MSKLIFALIVGFSLSVFALKEETKEAIKQKIKQIDPDINTVGYTFTAKDQALMQMIEDLAVRVEVLEKK